MNNLVCLLTRPVVLVAFLIGATLFAASEFKAEDKHAALRRKIREAVKTGDYAQAIRFGDQLTHEHQPLAEAAACLVEALVGSSQYEKAAKLILDKSTTDVSASLANQAGMGLHCGNGEQIKLAIACLKLALEQEPSSIYYRFNLGVTYWNGGYIAEAKDECEKVIKQDPGNVQAIQILQRIQKQDYHNKITSSQVRRRKVTLTLKAPKQLRPMIAGSWNNEGQIDQFRGWQPCEMKVQKSGTTYALFGHEVVLDTDIGRWYGVVVTDGSKTADGHANEDRSKPAQAKPLYFCRFPVYPITEEPLRIRLEEFPVQPPAEFLAPRQPLPIQAEAVDGRVPHTLLVCVDSDTWNIVMPLVKAGLMPRLEQLMSVGSYGVIQGDPPVSTIIFDRLNFGTAGTFGWVDWIRDSLETLKERGFDLIHAGNVAGTANTWRYLAEKGHGSLYISWAEQIYYGSGGKENVEKLSLGVKDVKVGEREVPSQCEKIWGLLDHREVAAPTKPTYSDTVAEELYDSGVKRFGEAMALIKKHDPRVVFIHFGFIDTSYHLFWDAMDSDIDYLGKPTKVARRYCRVIEGLHRLMDLFIGDLAAQFYGSGGNIIVFSDHGATGGFVKSWLGHEPDGFIVAAGPSFCRMAPMEPPAVIDDLAPTLFSIYGIPAPRSYPGHPLKSLKVFAPRTVNYNSPSPASSPEHHRLE